MRKFLCALAVCGVILIAEAGPACAQSDSADDSGAVPPGMELVDSSKFVKVLKPQGASMTQIENLSVVESAEGYSAAKLTEIDRRLDRIESDIKELKEMLKKDGGEAKK